MRYQAENCAQHFYTLVTRLKYSFSGIADALSNPIAYQSELEKRAGQLSKLEDDTLRSQVIIMTIVGDSWLFFSALICLIIFFSYCICYPVIQLTVILKCCLTLNATTKSCNVRSLDR